MIKDPCQPRLLQKGNPVVQKGWTDTIPAFTIFPFSFLFLSLLIELSLSQGATNGYHYQWMLDRTTIAQLVMVSLRLAKDWTGLDWTGQQTHAGRPKSIAIHKVAEAGRIQEKEELTGLETLLDRGSSELI